MRCALRRAMSATSARVGAEECGRQQCHCGIADIDAVQGENMEVHIESQSAVSSLQSRDGAGVCVSNAREVDNGFGSLAERTVELVREGTHDKRGEDAVIA